MFQFKFFCVFSERLIRSITVYFFRFFVGIDSSRLQIAGNQTLSVVKQVVLLLVEYHIQGYALFGESKVIRFISSYLS